MKHEVGDKVRIKTANNWYSGGNRYILTRKMSECCGKEAIITEINEEYYHIDIDDKFCKWTDEMFEDSMEDPLSEESLNNFTCLIPEPCICWEQRRYELVKSIMSNVLQKSILSDRDVKFNAQRAIDLADEVIKQLKEKEVKK